VEGGEWGGLIGTSNASWALELREEEQETCIIWAALDMVYDAGVGWMEENYPAPMRKEYTNPRTLPVEPGLGNVVMGSLKFEIWIWAENEHITAA
jgi:hypothetical protein